MPMPSRFDAWGAAQLCWARTIAGGYGSPPRVPISIGSVILTCLVSAGAGLAGCSSDAGAVPTDGGMTVAHDADFSKCADTPAVIYMPGVMATSSGGDYVAALVSVHSDGPPALESPQIGLNTWVFTVSDAVTGAPAQISVTSERPWMPLHGHGQSTTPVVTPGDAGMYTVTGIDFFMAGYWQIKLDLPQMAGIDDKLTFDICVPS